MPGEDALRPKDGGISTRWLRSISPTQIWVWLLRNSGFYGLWCETEPLCVQSLSQPWPRRPDFWLFTINNGCYAGLGCSRLFLVYGWFEWSSSRVVGFYHHEPPWSCSLWFRNCLWLRSVGCRPNPCTWNIWPPDDWWSWPSIIVIIKTSSTGPSGKKNCSWIAYATIQAPAPRKTDNEIQGSNQRLIAPLNPSNVPVSNTV